jgi:hypothetical protein
MRYCTRPSTGEYSVLSSMSAWMRSIVAFASSMDAFASPPASSPS